jgi:hypothetical protein
MTTNDNLQLERRQVATFLLTILQAVLNEQHNARLISKEAADYIYAAVKDQPIRQGWIE